MSQDPKPLEYATQVGEYLEPRQHSRLALTLIGLAALAGIGSIIHGLLYVVDHRLNAALLVAGGCGLCCATLGYLPAGHPRFLPALMILTVALACELAVVKLAHRDLLIQEALFGTLEDANGEHTAVYHAEVIRNGAIVWAGIGAMLWMYVLARVVRGRSQ
jgi:hypothetical protein